MPRQDAVAEGIGLTAGRPASRTGDNEAAVLARARRGDMSALDELYRWHRDRVYTLCLNLCGDRDDAQDLLQETFVRAWRGLPRFAGRSSFGTWLYRIAVNLACDAARKQRRAPDLAPIVGAADAGAVDEVRGVLTGLRPQYRTVLALRYYLSFSHKEISECLGWSLPRVKVTLHRAKRAFRDAYLETNDASEAQR